MDGNDKSVRYITFFIIGVILVLTLIIVVVIRESNNSANTTSSKSSTSTIAPTTTGTQVLGVSIGESQKDAPSLCNNGTVVVATFMDSTFPDYIVIKKGQSVRWISQDTIEQTVTFDLPGMKSQNIQPGGYFEYQFNQTGTYNYHSDFKPSMRGQVRVE